MTQEDKNLLLKDLCARLPYKAKVQDTYYKSLEPAPIWLLDLDAQSVRLFADEGYQSIEYIKPYLFPLSSMTEEQKQEYTYIVNYISSDDTENWKEGEFIYVEQFTQLMHFYHINHLDYMGLIDKGLAIDATDKNIY